MMSTFASVRSAMYADFALAMRALPENLDNSSPHDLKGLIGVDSLVVDA